MKITKSIWRAVAIGIGAGMLSTGAFAAEYVARIGHLESELQPRHQALEKVATLVHERTNGEVEFKLFPSSQLGNQRQMTEGVQLGTIQGTVSPAAFLGGFNPQVSILDIPYLLPDDRSAAQRIRQSEFGDKLLGSFSAKGVTAIALWPNGRKNFTSNKPISSVDSFAGQRFRVMNSKILIEQFNSLGASAIALPFGELYTSLQNGVVDGQENPLDTIHRMKFHEVQKYLAISEHGAMEDVVLFNPHFWNQLPKKHQQTIKQAFNEVIPELEANKESAQAAALKAIKAAGVSVSVISSAEKAAYRQRMYPQAKQAYLDFAGPEGNDLLKVYESTYNRLIK